MIDIWDGKDRRGEDPGRRFSDFSTCPFHADQHESIKSLWHKQDSYASRHDLEMVGVGLKGKLDKWVFALFVSSITVLIVLASSIFGYVATEAFHNSRHIAVMQVNQARLLRFFDIPAIQDPDRAREILENGNEVE